MQDPHAVIGILVYALLCLQPVLGYMHHRGFQKQQRRTLWSYGHIWLGRMMISLGIINGGLGFLLAQNTISGAKAYGVAAGLIWLFWVISVFIGERKRARADRLNYGQKRAEAGGQRVR